jgi:hypothetical protein
MKRDQEAITAALDRQVGGLDPSRLPIASPWSSNELAQLVAQDVFGPSGAPINSRASAMRLDGIARGRNKVCMAIGGWPLRKVNRDGILPPDQQPTWLYRTDGTMPRQRTVWTVDDLIFYGWSCWWRERGSDTFPLAATRLNQEEWTVDLDNRVLVRGQPVSDEQVILIPGYHEGILNFGKDVLADAKQLYAIVRDRLRNPTATTELHQTGGRELTDTERDAMLDHWRAARQKDGGTVGYTSKDIELKDHGSAAESTLLIEARNAAAVSQARILGLPAGVLDATTPKASLNYETQTGRNEELVDDLALYANPIEDRLSLDDCVPMLSAVRFDRTGYTAPAPSATGDTEVED